MLTMTYANQKVNHTKVKVMDTQAKTQGQPHQGQGHQQTGQDTRHAFDISAWFTKINKHYRV